MAEWQMDEAAILGALTGQATALLAGDRARFVGSASSAKAKAWLADRFTSLRAMGIGDWVPSIDRVTGDRYTGFQARLDIGYCFGRGCKRLVHLQLESNWDYDGQTPPALTGITPGVMVRTSPPWMESVLQARSGIRVVVAASAGYAGRLKAVLPRAEAAAKVADSYATSVRPGRYVVYLAGAREWDQWSDVDLGDWAAGYATQRTESLVVNTPEVANSYLDTVLKHELTHVSSLLGQSDEVNDADSWWLEEGLANHAAYRSFATYGGRSTVASFVRDTWDADLRVGEPATGASAKEANSRYGVALLGVSCLMKKYGKARTLAYVRAVSVQGVPLDRATEERLGTDWDALTRMCRAYIRQTV